MRKCTASARGFAKCVVCLSHSEQFGDVRGEEHKSTVIHSKSLQDQLLQQHTAIVCCESCWSVFCRFANMTVNDHSNALSASPLR